MFLSYYSYSFILKLIKPDIVKEISKVRGPVTHGAIVKDQYHLLVRISGIDTTEIITKLFPCIGCSGRQFFFIANASVGKIFHFQQYFGTNTGRVDLYLK